MERELQNELLLQMTDIMLTEERSEEKGGVQENVRKKEFTSTCDSFRKVLKKLEIVLYVLEK